MGSIFDAQRDHSNGRLIIRPNVRWDDDKAFVAEVEKSGFVEGLDVVTTSGFLRLMERLKQQDSPDTKFRPYILAFFHFCSQEMIRTSLSAQVSYWACYTDVDAIVDHIDATFDETFEASLTATADAIRSLPEPPVWLPETVRIVLKNIWITLGRPGVSDEIEHASFPSHWEAFRRFSVPSSGEVMGFVPHFSSNLVSTFLEQAPKQHEQTVNDIVDWTINHLFAPITAPFYDSKMLMSIVRGFLHRLAGQLLSITGEPSTDQKVQEIVNEGLVLLEEYDPAHKRNIGLGEMLFPLWSFLPRVPLGRSVRRADSDAQTASHLLEIFDRPFRGSSGIDGGDRHRLINPWELSSAFDYVRPSYFLRERLTRYFLGEENRRTRTATQNNPTRYGWIEEELIDDGDKTLVTIQGVLLCINEYREQLGLPGITAQTLRNWESRGEVRFKRYFPGANKEMRVLEWDEETLRNLALGSLKQKELADLVQRSPGHIRKLCSTKGWVSPMPRWEINRLVIKHYQSSV